ncbi:MULTISPECIES: MarR family winged helix-turn-helix transcriptional regulator [Desulfitobacterium]|uniref:Transcriptional regulator n=1 Tax=Desulfitobacterium dehalogenans (strain ATCC 51507 / DSM 9161 / JW/IU-DC1) TaxID=756499 RepID=I4AB29_DESDJ|nr:MULTISPECIES: MarR family transcriptional regulator [Desulfitobacterium]AFM01164.1 transcriptional regulator [Desulfitobacterium dehalogenans ATCC 51507]
MSKVEQEVSIGRCISILYRQSQAHFSKELQSYKIGSGQYAVLLALKKDDGVTQERLSTLLGIDRANITRAVTKLQNEGYILRKPDEEDKRIWRIYLTEQGRELLPILEGILGEWSSMMVKGLSPDQINILAKNLKTMTENLGYEWITEE